ncbi:MAG: hypothetical protein H6Q89_3199 [Myxococcaceae bacterium]|nr:hypothetical protein [Myxococcaceae bacterium]
MKGLIEYIARALVDQPEAVELKSSDAEGGVLYELKVAPDDVGKVIGRDGRTVNALRTVVAAAAQKSGQKARLEILDDRRNGQPEGSVDPVPEVTGA